MVSTAFWVLVLVFRWKALDRLTFRDFQEFIALAFSGICSDTALWD